MKLLMMQIVGVILIGGSAATEVTATVARDKSWDAADIGKLIPGQYLISLRVDNTNLINDAVATIQDDLGASNFKSLTVFKNLFSVSSHSSIGSSTPHLLAQLSPSGLEQMQTHSLVRLVEQDSVLGIKHKEVEEEVSVEVAEEEEEDSGATCQQQASPPWGLSRINQRGAFTAGSYFFNNSNQQGANVDVYVVGELGLYNIYVFTFF